MKKIISVLVVLTMLMSFGVVAFAAGVNNTTGTCRCVDHVEGACACCVYCPTLSLSEQASCLSRTEIIDGDTVSYSIVVCCDACTGLAGCECDGCVDERNGNLNIGDGDGALIPEETQETIVEIFQRILGQISDKFDEFFNTIFEFLRLDEILGRTE